MAKLLATAHLLALAAATARAYQINIDWATANVTMPPLTLGCSTSVLFSWKSDAQHNIMISTGEGCGDASAAVLVQNTTLATYLWTPEAEGSYVLFSSANKDCSSGNMVMPVTVVNCGPAASAAGGSKQPPPPPKNATAAPPGKAGKAPPPGSRLPPPAAKPTASSSFTPGGRAPPPPGAGSGTGSETTSAAAALTIVPWVVDMDPLELALQCGSQGINLSWDEGTTDVYMDSKDDCTFTGGQTLVAAADSGSYKWTAPSAPGTYVFKSTLGDNCSAGGMKVAVTVTC